MSGGRVIFGAWGRAKPRWSPRWPLFSFALGAAAIAVTLDPQLAAFFVDRSDALARGEAWRALTGGLVHGSAWHLAYDLALFLPLAIYHERRLGSPRFLADFAVLAVGVAALIRLAHGGEWSTFGGLSGIVYGLVPLVLLAPNRPVGVRLGGLIVALLVAKVAAEFVWGGWLWGGEELQQLFAVRLLPGAHLAGLALGLVMACRPPRASHAVSPEELALRRRERKGIGVVTAAATTTPKAHTPRVMRRVQQF